MRAAPIKENHDQRENRHDAIDQRRNHSLRQQIADRLQRREPRQDIADMPLFEKRGGKSYQMMKQTRAEMEVQHVLQNQQHQ